MDTANNAVPMPTIVEGVMEYLTFETHGVGDSRWDTLTYHRVTDGFAAAMTFSIDNTRILPALSQALRGLLHDDAMRGGMDIEIDRITGGQVKCLGALDIHDNLRTHTHLNNHDDGTTVTMGVFKNAPSAELLMLDMPIDTSRQLADIIDGSL